MNILVANVSYQLVRFQYKVPNHTKPFRANILPGNQVKLAPGDFTESQKNYVVQQLERYGGVPDSEVRGLSIIIPGVAPTRRSLVFSIQAPIKSDKIDEAREADEIVRQAVADREVEAAGCTNIPPNIKPELANMLRKTQQESSLHIEQIQDLETERGQKGGFNKTITVSKKAGKRKREVG
jgi:hypothetical protein